MSVNKNDKEKFNDYLKEKLSGPEQHAFEKIALDDPFLEEALEGANLFKDEFADDLASLEKQIIQTKKSIPWLRIAASFLFVFSISLIVWLYSTTSKPENSTIALKKDISGEKLPELMENPEKIVEVADEKEIEESLQIASAPTSNLQTATSNKEADKTEQLIAELTEVPSAMVVDAVINEESNNEKELITPESGNIAMAEERESADKSAYAISAVEPIARSARASAPPEELEVDLDVEMTEETVVEEVVFEDSPEENGAFVTIGVSPLIGWEKYNQYLVDSLRYPPQAIRMGIEGAVYVQAVIDADGNITEMIVVKGIMDLCDQEAMRLVREGPLFKPDSLGRKGKVIVRVKF